VLLAYSHSFKRRYNPLLLCDNLLAFFLLFNTFDVSFHNSFDLFPPEPYLIWTFNHLRAAKVHPFLYFVPLAFSKVKNCDQKLRDLIFTPFFVKSNFTSFVQNIYFIEYFIQNIVHFFEHFEFLTIFGFLVFHDHLFFFFCNFILNFELLTQTLPLFLHIDF
jgi:hypothetical protein